MRRWRVIKCSILNWEIEESKKIDPKLDVLEWKRVNLLDREEINE